MDKEIVQTDRVMSFSKFPAFQFMDLVKKQIEQLEHPNTTQAEGEGVS